MSSASYLVSSENDLRIMTQTLCVKKKNGEMTSTRTFTFKNGRNVIQDKCSSCGTTLFRITRK